MTHLRVKLAVNNVVDKSDGSPSPFIGLESIEGGTGRLNVTELPIKQAEDSLLHRNGDVLFSKLRPYLAKSLLVKNPGTGTAELLVLRPQQQTEPRYLFYSTLSHPWLEWAQTTSFGSKMPRTSWEAMGEYSIRLPMMEEQGRIADFLDVETARIDKLVENRRNQLALIGELRERYREDLLGLSAEIHSVRLMDLTDEYRPIVYGIVQAGPHDPDGVPYIKTGDLPDLDAERLSRTRWEIHRQFYRARVRPGDIVMAMRASIGAVAVVPETLSEANLTQGTARIAPRRDVDAEWLFEAIQTSSVRAQCMRLAVGSTFATLNIWDLRRIRIPFLPKDDQRRALLEFRARTRPVGELIARLRHQVGLLKERRQALITAAVTGQFDVTTASGADLS